VFGCPVDLAVIASAGRGEKVGPMQKCQIMYGDYSRNGRVQRRDEVRAVQHIEREAGQLQRQHPLLKTGMHRRIERSAPKVVTLNERLCVTAVLKDNKFVLPPNSGKFA